MHFKFLRILIQLFQYNDDLGRYGIKIQNEIRTLKMVMNYLKFAKKNKQYDELINCFKILLMIPILRSNRMERIKMENEVLSYSQKGFTYIPNYNKIYTIDNHYRNLIDEKVNSLKKLRTKYKIINFI